MSWKPEVEGLAERRRLAAQQGGEAAVARQHAQGRLTLRERIAALCDPEGFRELGSIAGRAELDAEGRLQAFTPANYVLGFGRLAGRPCVVGGEDFTLRGGSPSPAGLRKSVYAEDLALQSRLPLVRLLEGAGGSVARGPGADAAPASEPVHTPHRFVSIARCLGELPVASAALGPVAGFPAARLVASHFSVMTRETAQVMIAGPAVVERALGERVTKDELGGSDVHLRSGVVDNLAEDEPDAFRQIRRFLSYLPSHVDEPAPATPPGDDPQRREAELLSVVPRNRRRVYAMRRVIEWVLDVGSFFELAPLFGRTQITGLARLHGQPVGVLANDTRFYAGAMDAAGAQKVRRFVDLCDTFHLPVVSFVDEPGFMIGTAAERAGTLRHGTAAMCAVVQSSVPWASVLVRKAYGVAAAAHFGPDGLVLAWPSAESGALPVEGGVAVAFRRDIAAAPDPEARRHELEEALAARRSPFPRAESFAVHDLIDPRDTRPELCAWVESIQPRLRTRSGTRAHTYRP